MRARIATARVSARRWKRSAIAALSGPAATSFSAFFELHIEQGPFLEAEGKDIGVVTGVQAMNWYDVTVTGQESHAGTTPMQRRHDALLGAARMIEFVDACARKFRKRSAPSAASRSGPARPMSFPAKSISPSICAIRTRP